MSGRGRTTFAKRQKERARKEKQEAKAERRRQRKLAGPAGERPGDEVTMPAEDEAISEELSGGTMADGTDEDLG
jgi:hypothetical protein